MQLLTILGTPNLVFIGMPVFVFCAVMITEYLKALKNTKTPGIYYGLKPQIQWKYPIGAGILAIIGMLILSLGNN